jgi:ATPase subunit of ABC transporter with duplicated ATPase domains
MNKDKIALIGNSGIGKSSLSQMLPGEYTVRSMDKCLGKEYKGLRKTLDWILTGAGNEKVVELSTHEDMFWDFANEKRKQSGSDYHQEFGKIFFVFLYNSVPQSRWDRLQKRLENRRERKISDPEKAFLPLAWDKMTADLFYYVADLSINKAAMELDEILEILKTLVRLVS